MSNALIGFTGFVGSNLARQYSFDSLYNSRNISDISGRQFDLLVFSGARAVKWWANQNAEEDWESIQTAVDEMRTVTAERAILISTIDVLPNIEGATEDYDCSNFDNHAYGTNRLRLENEFRRLFEDLTIVRLPGLFGSGLKKNIIFDLLHGNMLEKIEKRSRFQFYDLDRLWSDIQTAIRNKIPLVHLFPEPVSAGDIVGRFFPDVEVGSDPAPVATYNLKTKYADVYGGENGYIYSKLEVLDRLERFIASVRGSRKP